ncbi:MAG: SAM-dependent methyltransferase, partial [Anaerolineae bacterium]|nr:SAM-dependent methyltransferase [Anaerolineae bacterium]
LTFAFAEVIGRSYGGGVLELEPNEAETLPLPLTNSEALDLDQLDKLVRAGEIETVLNLTDDVLLIRGLGLTRYETHMLRHMWQKLRNRRIQRKYKRSPNSQPISELVEFAAD